MSDDSKEIGRNLSTEDTLNKSPLRRSPRLNNSQNSDSNETSTQIRRSKRLSFTENSNLKRTNDTQETSSDQEASMVKKNCKTRSQNDSVKRDIEQSVPRRITRSQSKFSKTESYSEEENTLKLNPIEEEADMSETQLEDDSLINQQLSNGNREERNTENGSQETQSDCKLSNHLNDNTINKENGLETSQLDDSKHSDHNGITDTSAPVSIINTNVKVIDDENDREESVLTESPDTEKITDGKTDTSAPVSTLKTLVKVIEDENNREESKLTESPDTEKIKDGKTDTSAPVSTLKTIAKVIDDENDREESKLTELPDTEKITDKEKEVDRTETIKQKYSQLIDSSDIDYKIDELLSVTCSSDGESEDNRNEFLDSMAEEGEEDTPSEGSNDIVEVGEEINTTESELSTDESYESNSFIDDEEECRLLSGDEYDLSLEEPKKKSRIIQLDCESDDEIIKIERPKKERQKKPRKSRIIRIKDSSDEDVEIDVTTVENNESSIYPPVNKEETVSEDIGSDFQVASNKERITNDSSLDLKDKNSTKTETLTSDNQGKAVSEDIEDDFQVTDNKKEITSDSKDTDKDGTLRSSTPIKIHDMCETVQDIDSEIDNIVTNNEQSNSNEISTSSGPVFINIAMQIVGQKVNVIKNVNIEDTGKLPLNEHVKDIIDSLSSSIDDASEISVKLSAHYLDSESNEKHLSDCTINKCVTDVPTHDESKNNFTEMSKKKNNINSEEVSTSNEALRDYFRTVSKSSKQDLKHHQQSVEVAKNRGTKRKLVTPTNNNEDPSQEAPVVKKKKNKKRRHRKSTGNGVQMGILDEVLASNRTDVSYINDDWDMEDVAVKPVSFSKSQTKNKGYKLEKSENSGLKKFSAKDFKNSMLFDSSRVNRVMTKQVLKKKGIQLHHL